MEYTALASFPLNFTRLISDGTESPVSHFAFLIWSDVCKTEDDVISKSHLYEILSRAQYEIEEIHWTPNFSLNVKKELVETGLISLEPTIPTSQITAYQDFLLTVPDTPNLYEYSKDDFSQPTAKQSSPTMYPSPISTDPTARDQPSKHSPKVPRAPTPYPDEHEIAAAITPTGMNPPLRGSRFIITQQPAELSTPPKSPTPDPNDDWLEEYKSSQSSQLPQSALSSSVVCLKKSAPIEHGLMAAKKAKKRTGKHRDINKDREGHDLHTTQSSKIRKRKGWSRNTIQRARRESKSKYVLW